MPSPVLCDMQHLCYVALEDGSSLVSILLRVIPPVLLLLLKSLVWLPSLAYLCLLMIFFCWVVTRWCTHLDLFMSLLEISYPDRKYYPQVYSNLQQGVADLHLD